MMAQVQGCHLGDPDMLNNGLTYFLGLWRPVGHALCPLFSVLCHSCVNNTRYTQTMSGDMIVRAVVGIRAGEEITTQYRGPNTGNIMRRPDFPTNWLFNCDCVRYVLNQNVISHE